MEFSRHEMGKLHALSYQGIRATAFWCCVLRDKGGSRRRKANATRFAPTNRTDEDTQNINVGSLYNVRSNGIRYIKCYTINQGMNGTGKARALHGQGSKVGGGAVIPPQRNDKEC